MFLRLLGALCVLVLLVHLVRIVRPSRYGVAFGLLLLYVPALGRLPLNLAPGVNLSTLFLAVIWLLSVSLGGPPPGRRATAFRNLLLAWVGVSVFGLGFAIGEAASLGDLVIVFKRWLDPILFALLALKLVRHEDQRFAVACVVLAYLGVSAQAVREALDIGHKMRVWGLIGQPNQLGAFLAMYAPLILAIALFLVKGLLRYVHLGVVYLGWWGVAGTQSRGAFIGFAMGAISLLFVSGRKGLAVAGVSLVTLLWIFPGVLPEKVLARFETVYVGPAEENESLEDQLEPSAAARILLWRGALNMIIANPFGVGFNQFKPLVVRYIEGPLLPEARDAHNFYLLVWAELGIVGLVVLLAILRAMLADAWVVARRATDPFTRALGAGMFAGVLATLVVSFFGSHLREMPVSTYFWVLGSAVARARETISQPGA